MYNLFNSIFAYHYHKEVGSLLDGIEFEIVVVEKMTYNLFSSLRIIVTIVEYIFSFVDGFADCGIASLLCAKRPKGAAAASCARRTCRWRSRAKTAPLSNTFGWRTAP